MVAWNSVRVFEVFTPYDYKTKKYLSLGEEIERVIRENQQPGEQVSIQYHGGDGEEHSSALIMIGSAA